jgi:integrase
MAGKKQKRRGAGEGTVYQRKDERWVAEIRLEDGKRKALYARTQEEAIQKLHQAQYELKQGILATGPKQKVGEYLTYWLEQVKKHQVITASYLRYQRALKQIIPELGQIQLQKLTPRRIQEFYNKMAQKGQSPHSLRMLQRVLRPAFSHAVHERLMSRNPCEGVSLPTVQKRKAHPLTLEEAKRLLAAAQGTIMEPFIALALTVALRHGELLALHWSDIDLEEGTVSIKRTLTEVEGRKMVEGEAPKTEASIRTLLLPQPVRDILRAHRIRQREERKERLKVGSPWQEHDLVFCTRKGFLIQENNMRDKFYRLLAKAGLAPMRIHDLRHSASTLLALMGIHPRVAQEILGHTDLDMTFYYTHVFPSMQQEAAEKMKKLFEEGS